MSDIDRNLSAQTAAVTTRRPGRPRAAVEKASITAWAPLSVKVRIAEIAAETGRSKAEVAGRLLILQLRKPVDPTGVS